MKRKAKQAKLCLYQDVYFIYFNYCWKYAKGEVVKIETLFRKKENEIIYYVKPLKNLKREFYMRGIKELFTTKENVINILMCYK